VFAASLPNVKEKQTAGDCFLTDRIQSITTAKIFKASLSHISISAQEKENACLLFRGITSLTF